MSIDKKKKKVKKTLINERNIKIRTLRNIRMNMIFKAHYLITSNIYECHT